MDLIKSLNIGEAIFLFTLIFSFLFLVLYFFYNKFFIYSNRKDLSILLYDNEDYIDHLSLEDIFIMTSSLSRVYISYLFEIVLLKKNSMFFFKKGDESNSYIYPNLNFKNMKLIFLNFKYWIIFNLIFFVSCIFLFVFLVFLIETYIK